MVNNNMDQQPKKDEKESQKPVASPRPNETGSIAVSGHIRIFDPNTQEVIIEARA